MLKTCLFDLGNVLLFFSHEKMCRQMGALCGRTEKEIRQLVFVPKHHLRYERGEWTEGEFHRWFEELVGCSISLEDLRIATADIFVPNESILPVLDRLKQSGYRLVLLSNTNETHIELIRARYDVLERFDELVLSYQVGAVKPEAKIFETALTKIGCAPKECFYTDDIMEYVEKGRSFGLQAEPFTTTERLVEQLRERGIEL